MFSNKPPISNVNSNFMQRARCPICMEKPATTYHIRLAGPCKTPQEYFKITAWIKNFLKEELSANKNIDIPGLKSKLGLLNLSIDYKGFSPKIHYNMKDIYNQPIFALFTTCPGNHVYWIFNNPSLHPHVVHAKGKYSYSK